MGENVRMNVKIVHHFFEQLLSRRCVIFIVVCPPFAPHNTRARTATHHFHEMAYGLYNSSWKSRKSFCATHADDSLNHGTKHLIPPCILIWCKNGLKITHCRYNSFWFLMLGALICNNNTKTMMKKKPYMESKKRWRRSPPPYPFRLLTQDRGPRHAWPRPE